MSEDRRRCNHAGVIAAFENFQVGAARQRSFDAHANSAGRERPWIDLLDPQIFPSMQHRRFHPRRVSMSRRKKSRAEKKLALSIDWLGFDTRFQTSLSLISRKLPFHSPEILEENMSCPRP